jgi:hypothetical protein
MILAPGVQFDEGKHEYFYQGEQLSGITGLISKNLGLNMQSNYVDEYREEGLYVHRTIQRWIETGEINSVHQGILWFTETFSKNRIGAYSEVLISDFSRYASSVDIVVETENGDLILFDIKNGVFKRDYVTWQLSVYKYLVVKHTNKKVNNCVCISLKDKEYYPIFTKSVEQVERLLYG